jgi:predicted transcriptional regulator
LTLLSLSQHITFSQKIESFQKMAMKLLSIQMNHEEGGQSVLMKNDKVENLILQKNLCKQRLNV